MSDSDHPFITVTAVCDASARPAAVTLGHGDAMQRAMEAVAAHQTGGLDLVELPIAPGAFAALRTHLQLGDGAVTAYDIFPLSMALPPQYRPIAGQFLAAELLWTLEEQGMLKGVPFTIQFDVPKGWDKDPKALHARLLQEKALDLSPASISIFKKVKRAWDESALAAG